MVSSSSDTGSASPISSELYSCAAVDPSRPTAANTASAVPLSDVGNDSADRQSSDAQAPTATALNRHAAATAATWEDAKAKQAAKMAAPAVLPASCVLRPTRSTIDIATR